MMEDTKERSKRRSLWNILITVGVGGGMITNVIQSTETLYKMGEEIAPKIQGHVGSIGSEAFRYGLPGIAFLGTLAVGVIAVVATDKYLLDRTNQPNL